MAESPDLTAARSAYQSTPDALQNYTDQAFIDWWAQNAATTDIAQYPQDFALLAALADNGDAATKPAATAVLTKSGYQNVPDTTSVPLEQGALTLAAPGLISQIQGDATRQQTVADLSAATTAGYNNLQGVLDRSTITTDPVTGQPTSVNLDAQRANANATTAAITAAATKAATDQLAALQTSVATLQGNLSGSLAQQAGALQQAIGSYTTNLGVLDASQRQNLATQIASQQQNLETSIASQQAALQQEVASLQGNATAAAQARRAALTQQLSELTAAAAPLADARVKSAEALATSINIGLQSTQDQLRAEAARNGITGGSTMQDAALARSAIDAGQGAAGALGAARVQNATDLRDIGVLGANQGYSISDALAGQIKGAADMGATGTNTLANSLATGTQTLGDAGATGLRTIGDTTATTLSNINNYGAGTTLTNANAGIAANKGILDAGANKTLDIGNALASANQAAAVNNAGAQSNYFDQLYPNALNGAQIGAALPAAQANSLTSIIPLGNAGTNSALNTLNWWASNPTAPTTTATLTAPNTTGNAIGNLGAGLLGGAFQAGAANNWWQTPKLKAPETTGAS